MSVLVPIRRYRVECLRIPSMRPRGALPGWCCHPCHPSTRPRRRALPRDCGALCAPLRCVLIPAQWAARAAVTGSSVTVCRGQLLTVWHRKTQPARQTHEKPRIRHLGTEIYFLARKIPVGPKSVSFLGFWVASPTPLRSFRGGSPSRVVTVRR